ncbi:MULTISPECIES: hypothetical protein [Clostridia]|uniref:hypothetical protein n=1 Tax=Clostridia TaxID=186801 RepID=UPI000EA33942|nr:MULTISPECIES: hypothetical protein [Clostridia]NBJ70698.1 hypothetical protein [Roseburia sp. 1XD42-34]RKI76813.1 hypothetical protein D7V87_12290 [Clostridium sp. 1xD42-85]
MRDNLKDIPYLDEKSLQKEISAIITNGLDPKVAFWSYLATIYKQIGLKFLFKDFIEILFTFLITLVIGSAFILSTIDYIHVRNVNLYTIVFIWSPMTYMVMAYLFFVNQKQKTTYEVEMTCKYNFLQLAAFRMLMFSAISMLMNGLFIYALILQYELNFFYAFLLSSTSLFLFAVLFLYVQFHTRTHVSKIILLIVWLGSNLLASYYSMSFYMNFLKQIPFYVYGIIAIVAIVFYLKSLKGLLFTQKMKGWM